MLIAVHFIREVITSVPLSSLHVVLFLLVIVSFLATVGGRGEILGHEKGLENDEIYKDKGRYGEDDL